LFRQHRPEAHIPVVSESRVVFAGYVLAETKPLFDAENPVNGADGRT
jgi:hypothetical protein